MEKFILHNGTPHPLDINGKRLSADREFKPIRAGITERNLGELSIRTTYIEGAMPLTELSLDGSLENPRDFKKRLTAIHKEANPDEQHLVVVSPIALAAIRLANMDTDENIHFGYPGGILRNLREDGKFIEAQRIDIPSRSNPKRLNGNKIRARRNDLLEAEYPWLLKNHMPEAATIKPIGQAGIHLGRLSIIEPMYPKHNHIKLGTADQFDETPVVEPRLKSIRNLDAIENGQITIAHSRVFPAINQLRQSRDTENKLAHMVMLHNTSRDAQGFQSNQFTGLAVYSDETLNELAKNI